MQLRLMEKKKELVKQSEVDEVLDGVVGVTLTALSGMPARIGGHDLLLWRKVEQVVFEVRREI